MLGTVWRANLRKRQVRTCTCMYHATPPTNWSTLFRWGIKPERTSERWNMHWINCDRMVLAQGYTLYNYLPHQTAIINWPWQAVFPAMTSSKARPFSRSMTSSKVHDARNTITDPSMVNSANYCLEKQADYRTAFYTDQERSRIMMKSKGRRSTIIGFHQLFWCALFRTGRQPAH